jgi:hypothetical protein
LVSLQRVPDEVVRKFGRCALEVPILEEPVPNQLLVEAI